MGLAILKPKELRREYSAFIQEPKKVTYYTKQFDKMKEKNSKFSFNIWGLLFNIYWCFYRKMLGWAASPSCCIWADCISALLTV